MPQKDQNCNDKNLRVMVKILMDSLATNRMVYRTTNFLLPCLTKFCILEGLIYLKNINIFSIQEPAIASQLYRGYIYILI
jgi:hypothetical protein